MAGLGIDRHAIENRPGIDVVVSVPAAQRPEIHRHGFAAVQAFVERVFGLDVRIDPAGRYQVGRLVPVIETNVSHIRALLHQI